MILPDLASKIGLNEAIVLQQINYWIVQNEKKHNNFKDGYYWTFNSYERWKDQFPFWSVSTIKRIITNLEKQKLIVVGNFNRMKIDRTKWYRIDHKVLEIVENRPLCQNDPTNVSNWPDHSVKLTRPIPETNTETNTETKYNNDRQYAVTYFDAYKKMFNTNHPYITQVQLDRCNDVILEFANEYDLTMDNLYNMISGYFNDNLNCDYNINHFAQYEILKNRYYKHIY